MRPTNPNPQSLVLDEELSDEDVLDFKRPDCKHYLTCLCRAVDEGWQQFHCQSCRAFVYRPHDSDELKFASSLFRKLRDSHEVDE